MKWFIVTTLLTFSIQLGNTVGNKLTLPITKQLTKIEQVLKLHTEFAQELYDEQLITVEPKQFAKMLLVMTYCESGLQHGVVSKDGYGSHGIYQFTKTTRKYLNIPDDITKTDIKQQNQYYKRFIRMVGKAKTTKIKSLLDLHAMNYTPTNMFKNILSRKGAILTRSDLIEFQQLRVSENKEVKDIYNSLWNHQ